MMKLTVGIAREGRPSSHNKHERKVGGGNLHPRNIISERRETSSAPSFRSWQQQKAVTFFAQSRESRIFDYDSESLHILSIFYEQKNFSSSSHFLLYY